MATGEKNSSTEPPRHVQAAFDQLVTDQIHHSKQLLKHQLQPFPRHASIEDISLVCSDVKFESDANNAHKNHVYMDVADDINHALQAFFEEQLRSTKTNSRPEIHLYTRIVWIVLPDPCLFELSPGYQSGKLGISWVVASSSGVYMARKYTKTKLTEDPFSLWCYCCDMCHSCKKHSLLKMGLEMAERNLKDIQDELKS